MKDVFHDVRFRKCARGYLLDAGGVSGMIGQLYAFDDIDGVARWFLETFTEAQAIEAQRAATVQQGAVADESAVPGRNAP